MKLRKNEDTIEFYQSSSAHLFIAIFSGVAFTVTVFLSVYFLLIEDDFLPVFFFVILSCFLAFGFLNNLSRFKRKIIVDADGITESVRFPFKKKNSIAWSELSTYGCVLKEKDYEKIVYEAYFYAEGEERKVKRIRFKFEAECLSTVTVDTLLSFCRKYSDIAPVC